MRREYIDLQIITDGPPEPPNVDVRFNGKNGRYSGAYTRRPWIFYLPLVILWLVVIGLPVAIYFHNAGADRLRYECVASTAYSFRGLLRNHFHDHLVMVG
jgi:hypothetical protein